MRSIAACLASIAMLGCATASNDPVATYVPHGDGYLITLTGRRQNMVHDPISLLFRGTYPVRWELPVPRITGEIDGAEIPVRNDSYSFVGRIKFTPPYMDIDLYHDDTDDKVKRPFTWNGRYLLQVSTQLGS